MANDLIKHINDDTNTSYHNSKYPKKMTDESIKRSNSLCMSAIIKLRQQLRGHAGQRTMIYSSSITCLNIFALYDEYAADN